MSHFIILVFIILIFLSLLAQDSLIYKCMKSVSKQKPEKCKQFWVSAMSKCAVKIIIKKVLSEICKNERREGRFLFFFIIIILLFFLLNVWRIPTFHKDKRLVWQVSLDNRCRPKKMKTDPKSKMYLLSNLK